MPGALDLVGAWGASLAGCYAGSGASAYLSDSSAVYPLWPVPG